VENFEERQSDVEESAVGQSLPPSEIAIAGKMGGMLFASRP
jgi:hypothetical protein